MKKLLSLLLAVLTLCLLLAGCGSSGGSSAAASGSASASKSAATSAAASGQKFEIIAAHGAAESTTLHKAWLKFQELVQEKSGGNITVNLYPNQELGGDREYTEACTQGNVTMGSPSTANMAGFAPAVNAFETPFLFSDRETVYKVLDGTAGQAVLDSLSSGGLKGLGYYENGFRQLTANKIIKSPDDLKGLKIRVMENEIHLALWTALGANPSPLAFGELFTALQQKTFDAQENPLELIYNTKFYEVQKYVMMTKHIYTPYVIYMNLDFWNNLPADYQTMIQDCVKESMDYQRSLCEQAEKDCRDAINASGKCEVVDLTDAERQTFVDKCSSVYDMVKKAAGGTYAQDVWTAAGANF